MTGKRRLLIVEDNDDLRENLADIAKLYDFEVLTSGDAENAIRISKTYHPDVVLPFNDIKVLPQMSHGPCQKYRCHLPPFACSTCAPCSRSLQTILTS